MDYEKEIPFGAFDSELMHQEIFIPEGFEATIDGNKIILKKIESEDEKVREELIGFIYDVYNKGSLILSDEHKDKWIAWLEKQGNQNHIEQNIEMVEALRTEYEKGRADAIAEMQKHNDAIKPKFNVGDYIVSNSGLKYYITGIFKGYYMTESGCIITLDAQDNYKVYNNFWSKEEEELLNNICNLLQNPDSIKANQHVIGNIVDWLKSIKDRVYPKHEWKQENTDDLTDFENTMMHIGESFFGNNAGLDPNDTNVIKEQANTLLGLVPSKEWSEEDEEHVKSILERLDGMCKKDATFTVTRFAVNQDIDWLKSLKERYTWKPSDDQMRALEYIINNASNTSYSCKIAKGLLEQLKKLKGE